MRSLLLVLIAACTLCGIDVHDAAGRKVQVKDASRIVAIGGGVAETLCALGAENSLVGVGDSSYPPSLKKLPQVVNRHAVSAEGVIALNPSLVIAAEGAKPDAAFEQIGQAGIPVIRVSSTPGLEPLAEKVRLLAKIVGRESKGAEINEKLRNQLAFVRERTKAAPKQKVLFIMSARGAPMAGGRGTPIDAMIQMAGAENAITEFEGFKPLTPEAAAVVDADLILVPSGGHGFTDAKAVLANPGLALIKAAREGRVASMDLLYMMGFGTRMGGAVQDIAHHAYPDRVPLSGEAPAH